MSSVAAPSGIALRQHASLKAAAGCGKTYALAQAVVDCADGYELVLTHTHAGVEALRKRLKAMGASPSTFQVWTIDAWALRLCRWFPQTSRAAFVRPSRGDYAKIHAGALRLLRIEAVQRVIAASYTGVFVDEYQDCSKSQHEVVRALARVVPCRVLGDPLQAIFGFAGPVVDWAADVVPVFAPVPDLLEPWRWKNRNEDLGRWLVAARRSIESGQAVDLANSPVNWIEGSDPKTRDTAMAQACWRLMGRGDETVVVIGSGFPNEHRRTAKRISRGFSCIESVACEDLYRAAAEIDGAHGYERALYVVDFASQCMSNVTSGSGLGSIINAFRKQRKPTRSQHGRQLAALLSIVDDDDPCLVEEALRGIGELPSTNTFRRELFEDMCEAAKLCRSGDADSLLSGVTLARNRLRHLGRRVFRYSVGSTLLVKGLEFDHAVIVDGDGHDAKNLYVAMTRGSRSLTIVSASPSLSPSP